MKQMRSKSGLTARVLWVLAWCITGPVHGGWLEEVSPTVPAPQLELPDSRGGFHRLDALAGKVVLVNFWATWCPPCIEEMPSILRLRERFDDARLEVLGVTVEEPAGRVRLWEGRVGLDFPTLLDGRGDARRQWQVRVFPSSYLVDGAGRIRYRALGPVDWDGGEALEAVRNLLSEMRPEAVGTVSADADGPDP